MINTFYTFVATSACLVFICSASDIKIEYLEKPECQRKTKNGDYLSVHYTGTLADSGKKFDSSVDRGTPFEFELGNNEVIQGWDQGMQDMCIGEKRKLTVPPHLGYGDKGAGDVIPGGATLVFEVELIAIDEAPKPNNVFSDIDKDGDKMLSQDEVRLFMLKQMGGQSSAVDDSMIDRLTKDFMKLQDVNKDGKIQRGEFAKPTHKSKDEL